VTACLSGTFEIREVKPDRTTVMRPLD